jgi:hypothetical protein
MGVALVASAAKSLTFSTCKDRVTMVVNAVAAVVSFYYPVTWYSSVLLGDRKFNPRKRYIFGIRTSSLYMPHL